MTTVDARPSAVLNLNLKLLCVKHGGLSLGPSAVDSEHSLVLSHNSLPLHHHRLKLDDLPWWPTTVLERHCSSQAWILEHHVYREC